MEITFLGTGTSMGVPVIACDCEVCRSPNPYDKRKRASLLVQEGEFTLVIDTGPDFRDQMLRERVKNLDVVLLTHEHKDHLAGLDDVRAFNHITGKRVPIYGEERVLNAIRQEFAYVFAGHQYPGIPEIDLHPIEPSFILNLGPLQIQPIRAMHHRLPVLGYRIGPFAYLTDANFISEEELTKLEGVEVLAIGALRWDRHISHWSVEEALEVINRVQPRQALLTHISHRMGLAHEAAKKLPAGVELAYDGMKLFFKP